MAQSKANPLRKSAYERLPDGLQAGPRHSAPHLQLSVLICSRDEKPPEGNPAGTTQLSSLKEDLVPCSRTFHLNILASSTYVVLPNSKVTRKSLFLIYLGNQYNSCSSRTIYLWLKRDEKQLFFFYSTAIGIWKTTGQAKLAITTNLKGLIDLDLPLLSWKTLELR